MTAEKTLSPPKANTSPYDVADHLRTPEDMAAYLDAWLEDADDDILRHRAHPRRSRPRQGHESGRAEHRTEP